MSREEQQAIRELVAAHPFAIRQHFQRLRALHQEGYCQTVTPSRYAPPCPGIPLYGCIGCEQGLPWHTSVKVTLPNGSRPVVDAHSCWGPEPTNDHGKAIAAQFHTELLRLFKREPA